MKLDTYKIYLLIQVWDCNVYTLTTVNALIVRMVYKTSRCVIVKWPRGRFPFLTSLI